MHNEEYNKLVPVEIFDIEDSDEIAEMYLNMDFEDFSSLKCDTCGADLTDEDIDNGNEICSKCWKEWNNKLEKAKGINQ